MSRSPGTCPRHPTRPPKPPPPPPLLSIAWPGASSSAWRWPVGGPITDFGDEGEAGPSRTGSADERCSCDSDEDGASAGVTMPARLPRRRKQRTRVAAAAALALLSLTSSVSAGPLPATPTPTPTPTPMPTRVLNIEPRSIHTDPLYTIGTIPSIPVIAVPETVLPIYLSKSDDGHWYKIDNAWSLYGRVAVSLDVTSSL